MDDPFSGYATVDLSLLRNLENELIADRSSEEHRVEQ
jgi:hypothetical protein